MGRNQEFEARRQARLQELLARPNTRIRGPTSGKFPKDDSDTDYDILYAGFKQHLPKDDNRSSDDDDSNKLPLPRHKGAAFGGGLDPARQPDDVQDAQREGLHLTPSTYVPPRGLDSSASFRPSSPAGLASSNLSFKDHKDEQKHWADARKDALLLQLMEDPALCRSYLDQQSFIQDGWCNLATKIGNAGGYVRITLEGAHDLIQIHVLALWSRGLYALAGQEASHLCGRANCFNADHLVWESHLLNTSRIGCPVFAPKVACECCNHIPSLFPRLCNHDGENGLLCIKYCAGFADHFQFQTSGLAHSPAIIGL